MKDRLLVIFAGPVVMAILCAAGMPAGYFLGWIASCVVIPILAIALGVVVARLSSGGVAMLAVILGVLPGLAAAHGFRNLRELDTGEFARGVPLAKLPAVRERDRLTLRDGEMRRDLGATVTHVSTYESPSSTAKEHLTTTCVVFPIVPAGWTPGAPIHAWRFGDREQISGRPIDEIVLQPGHPDELCRRGIAKATAGANLETAPDAVYLEALVSESSSRWGNTWSGPFAVALLGALWLVVAVVQAARDALDDRRRRR